MITWLIQKHRSVLVVTFGFSVIGSALFFRISEITFDLPILVPLVAFAATLFYVFCYSWPFIGAAVIEVNKKLNGANWPKAESMANFLLWLSILGMLLAILGIAVGAAESALGISANCGLLAGCCYYLSRENSRQRTIPPNDR